MDLVAGLAAFAAILGVLLTFGGILINARLKAREDQLEQIRTNIGLLQADNGRLRQDLTQANTLIAQANDRIAHLETERDAFRRRFEEADSERADLVRRLDQAENRIADCERQRGEQSETIATLLEERDRLVHRVFDLEKQVGRIEEDAEHASAVREAHRSEGELTA